MRFACDVAAGERTIVEVLRTHTTLFLDLIEARRNRREAWFARPSGHIDIANVPIPTRLARA
jgi:peptidylprolyl isomerase